MQLQLYNGPAKTLAAHKEALLARTDILAGKARLRYITVAPGQAETYQAKAADARAFITAGSPPGGGATYRWIRAEARAQGTTLAEAAATILQMEDAWAVIGADIEEARITGKRAIAAAATLPEILAAARVAATALSAL